MRKGTVPIKRFLIPLLVISIVLISLSNCGNSSGSCIQSADVDLAQSQCLAETINMACGLWLCSFATNVLFSFPTCTVNDCTTLNCGNVIVQGLVATTSTGFLGEEVFSSGSTTLFACDLNLPVPTPPSSPLPTPQ